MANNMAEKTDHLVSLNGEYVYSAVNDARYAPLRINKDVATMVENAIATEKPGTDSCIRTATSTWCNGKFMLVTEFGAHTKCTAYLNNPSTRTKSDMCLRKLCAGQCTDTFMRKTVARNIMPGLYNNNQK